MNPPAREVLTVFVDGNEIPGVIFYGLWPRGSSSNADFPADAWPDAEVRPFRLHGESWEIVGWDVALLRWPHGGEWTNVMRRTLQKLVDSGAVVAWVSAEGSPFSDPPYLFSPDWMANAVFAAMTSAGEFFCPMTPDLPVRTLSDDELGRLRSHARGLADAPS